MPHPRPARRDATRWVVVAAVVAVAAGAAACGSPAPPWPARSDTGAPVVLGADDTGCLPAPATTVAMDECATSELDDLGAQLAAAVNAEKSLLSPGPVSASEAAFEHYEALDCQDFSLVVYGGTLAPLAGLECRQWLTTQRIEQIRTDIENAPGGGSATTSAKAGATTTSAAKDGTGAKALSPPVPAAAGLATTVAYSRACERAAKTEGAMQACATSELAGLDAKLTSAAMAFDRTLAGESEAEAKFAPPGTALPAFGDTSGEAAFASYEEAECSVTAGMSTDPGRRALAKTVCEIQLTVARLDVLEQYERWR